MKKLGRPRGSSVRVQRGVIDALLEGPLHFNALKRKIGHSPATLSKCLGELEEKGIVSKTDQGRGKPTLYGIIDENEAKAYWFVVDKKKREFNNEEKKRLKELKGIINEFASPGAYVIKLWKRYGKHIEELVEKYPEVAYKPWDKGMKILKGYKLTKRARSKKYIPWHTG